MSVDSMTLKKIIDFHGRLCPELVIGAKVCEYARRLFSKRGELSAEISVIAENRTSALDAIQVLLGATAGNQRLKVFDFGKHNYTFLPKDGKYGFRLLFRDQQCRDENEYQTLKEKIMKDRVSLDELVHFQFLSDNRVKRLLASPIEDLFSTEQVGSLQPALYLS
jgi:formylmethanofuran dehydrogenase subunit E